jgi:chitinase
MPHLRVLDPSLDIDLETGKLYKEWLIIDILDTRVIICGAPVPYTVNAPCGNSWQITMNRYPNGQNGASPMQANPNAGWYGADDSHDCGNVAISSSSDDPDLRPVTEHIQERQMEPRAQGFMMSTQTRRGDSTLVSSAYTSVPERNLDLNSYLFQDYSVWDPNGPCTG